MRRGVRLAVDVGSVRVGVARCDPDGMLAVPECTLARAADSDGPATDIDQLAELVAEYRAFEVLIGLPLTLAGAEGPAAAAGRGYAEAVARRVAPVGVRLVDERLSTVTAARSMRDAGRKQRRSRPVIDQAAAVVILQAALDAERATGRPPGQPVASTTTARQGGQGDDAGESGAQRAEAPPS